MQQLAPLVTDDYLQLNASSLLFTAYCCSICNVYVCEHYCVSTTASYFKKSSENPCSCLM